MNADLRPDYVSSTISGIEEADAVLLVGTTPRMEAPLINARLRKARLHGELPVSYIGTQFNSTFSAQFLENDISVLDKIADGASSPGAKSFFAS